MKKSSNCQVNIFKLKTAELESMIKIKDSETILAAECNISGIKKNWKTIVKTEYENYTKLKYEIKNIRMHI